MMRLNFNPSAHKGVDSIRALPFSFTVENRTESVAGKTDITRALKWFFAN